MTVDTSGMEILWETMKYKENTDVTIVVVMIHHHLTAAAPAAAHR